MGRTAKQMEAPWTAEAAELHVYAYFARDFKRRHPNSVHYRQLEYIGLAGGRAPKLVPGVQEQGKPGLNRVLEALQTDFKNPGPRGESRKPDGIGISKDGLHGEVIEVKTAGQKSQLGTQLEEILDILRSRVNAHSGVRTMWTGSPWRPIGPQQLYFQPYPHITVSFEPTYRLDAPPGGLLYEVQDRRKRLNAQTAVLPEAAAKAVRRATEGGSLNSQDPAGWAEAFARDHADLVPVLRGLSGALGAALCITGIVLAIDPVPGDEVAAFAAAAALLAFAQNGVVPKGYRTVTPGT